MIANITSGEGVKGVIMYNEEKVKKGEGKLLLNQTTKEYTK